MHNCVPSVNAAKAPASMIARLRRSPCRREKAFRKQSFCAPPVLQDVLGNVTLSQYKNTCIDSRCRPAQRTQQVGLFDIPTYLRFPPFVSIFVSRRSRVLLGISTHIRSSRQLQESYRPVHSAFFSAGSTLTVPIIPHRDAAGMWQWNGNVPTIRGFENPSSP